VLRLRGGIIVFYDMLDKNLEVTAVGRDEEKLPVLDEDGAAVPGLFQMTSTMVTPGGFVQEKGAFDAEGGEEDEAAEQQNSISGSDAFNYTDMPFGSKAEFKEWIKSYCQNVRQAHKDAGTPQEDIKAFMSDAKSFAGFLLKKFKDLKPLMAANCNPDACIVFEYWPDESASNPNYVYIAGGLKATKV